MRLSLRRAFIRWVVVAGLVGVVGLAGVFLYPRLAGTKVTITTVVHGPVVEAFYATGTLQPVREYPVASNVEGIVTEVLVDKGEAVEQGQKVAFVRVEEYQMRYRQAQADLDLRQSLADETTSPVLEEYDARLRAAKEQLDIVQRELERLTQLRQTGSASQSDFDRTTERVQNYRSEVESLKARRAKDLLGLQRDLAVARAGLDIALWNLDQQNIRSPIEGVVLDRPVSVGTRVKGNDPLLRLADVRPERLVMRAAVDEEDKTRLTVEQVVNTTLYAYPGLVFKGRVKQIYPQADPERRTFEVDVAIEPVDRSFSPGMTGELAFVVEAKEQALVVPAQAVQGGEVWLVRGGRVARLTPELGLRSVERIEILQGLTEGDQVVVGPASKLTDGQAVRTVFVDPQEAANMNRPAEAEGGAFRGFN
ncbi:MAG: efflux RND transporter periplasmic adaptor subunit [Phycisphaeraceae bacterium]|nr:efflux RND transporter periplasmic adaptor subunit [Phycisphaeraceae bacterium]